MIGFVVGIVYGLIALAVARKLYVKGHIEGEMWGQKVDENEGYAYLLSMLFAGLWWPIVGLGLGLKAWFHAPVKQHQADKDAAKLEWQEMEKFALRCKDPQEKQIMLSASRSLYEKWASM